MRCKNKIQKCTQKDSGDHKHVKNIGIGARRGEPNLSSGLFCLWWFSTY